MDYRHTDDNFLKIDDEAFYNYAAARFAVFEAPYEHTSSYHAGSRRGPAAIIQASQFVETYDEELDTEAYRLAGIATLAALDFSGAIDAAAVALIQDRVATILRDVKIPVMLGAEHTVTLGAVQAARHRYPDLSVLQIDAHSDLRDAYQGNRYSHASVMARVHELDVPLVQVGIRAQCREEAELIRRSPNIHTLYAHQIQQRGLSEWTEAASQHLTPHVYVTIDADGFDPSIVPAVGTAEPNGLTWQQGIELLRRVSQNHHVVGFDVVEVAPQPPATLSEYLLAKLVYKFMGLLVTSPQNRG